MHELAAGSYTECMNWQQVQKWKKWAGYRFIPKIHELAAGSYRWYT
jgi:hypothetical protein